ncbi:MAG TPA: glycoside hydrolase family 38 C-terminal domain-containing protein [bacterium]|nr:glycoside hydrolase family 38 C-terminal domain-containing protein [bacterium]
MAEIDPISWFARKYAAQIFEFIMNFQNSPPERWRITAIGQSHLDAAWKWRKFQTISKAKATFKNALRHISQYDEFKFSMPAPQYYEWMKDRNPPIFRAMKAAVKGKQWELVGGMWIEPDGNMPDGESMVRQCLYGQRFFLNHFGKIAEVAWLPDTFGFAWSLPQIFAKSGMRYFWTSKPAWNDTTKFPFSSFLWESPDGTHVLAHISSFSGEHFLKMKDYRRASRLVNFRETLTADYETRLGKIADKLSHDLLPEAALFYGWGDGGHGPKTFEIEAVEALKEKGFLEVGTAQQFFEKLEPYRERLPVWKDEIYLEFHRGCLTTQGWIKNANRRAEIAIRNAEITHSMNSLFGDPYPGEVLRENWKKLLFNQFHDILPGSSIPEVYEDARSDYDEFFATVYDLIRSAIDSIGQRINTAAPELADTTPVIVYNSLSWPRTATAFLRVEGPGVEVVDIDGRHILSQVIDLDGFPTLTFIAEDVPELGYRTYYLKKRAESDESESATEEHAASGPAPMARVDENGVFILENELIRAAIDPESGCVTSLYDKISDRETLSGPSNRLRLYHDDNPAYPAWNIDPGYKRKERRIEHPAAPPKIIDNGEVAATVQVEQAVGGSRVTRQVGIFRDRPLLIFTTTVDWHEKKSLLKVDFETAIRTERVASDIPYAAIERPTSPRLPAQKARWELPCQKWIDLSDARSGVTLLNQDKYGFSIDGEKISLSLLRGPAYPAPIFNAWGLPPAAERPQYTDQGKHTIRYGLYPHPGDWREGGAWKMGNEFCNTLMVFRTDHHEGVLPRETTALSCRSRSSYIGAIKRPEDNPDRPDTLYHQIVVRLVEAAGRPDTVTLKFGTRMTITDAKETDLLEFSQKPIGEVRHGEVAIPMKPFEIKTVKITLVNTEKLAAQQAAAKKPQ